MAETLTATLCVSAARIARLNGSHMEILANAGSPLNPYRENEMLPLAELYCGAVVRGNGHVVISDADASAEWRRSAEAARGMVSYLGYPVHWPDGAMFGTLSLLNESPKIYSAGDLRLARQFCGFVEDHLALLAVSPRRTRRAGSQPEIHLDEERYRLLVDNSVDNFFLHDHIGRILDVNHQTIRHTGYTRAELLQLNVSDFAVSFNYEQLLQLWVKMQPGTSREVRDSHRRKDGTTFPVEVHVSCLRMDGQKMFFSMIRNISERLEAERAVQKLNEELEQRVVERTLEWRKSADLLQSVMDGTTDTIFVKDLEGRYLLVNRAAAKHAGLPASEILGKTLADVLGEATETEVKKHEVKVISTGESSTIEETIPFPTGSRRFLATRSPYRDPEGNIIGLIGVARDITEKVRAEEALRESDARWQFAVDGLGDGIWDWNVETGDIFYSRQWKALLGFGESEIGDSLKEWSGRVHPDDSSRFWQAIRDHVEGNTPDFSLTHRMRAKDGSWKWILDRGKAIKRGPDGRPLRLIGTHTDLTSHKIIENELRLERERLMLATEASRLGVWEYDLEANVISCDARWYEIFAITPGAVDSIETFNKRVHPEDVPRVTRERLSALAESQKIHRIDFRIMLPNGEMRWIVSSACLIERTELTPRRLVGIVMDVTEIRLAEKTLEQANESLRQAERLAKIGSWTFDLRTSSFACSDMLYEMNGRDPSGPPLTLDGLRAMHSAEDYQKVEAALKNCIETGEPYVIEVEHLRQSGPPFIVQVRGQANRDSSGKIVGLTGTLQDITEREEARARLQALTDHLPHGAIYRLEQRKDGKHLVSYVSAGILTLTGVAADEITRDRNAFKQVIHEDDVELYQSTLDQALATGNPFDCQFRVRTRDGRLIWMHSKAAPRLHVDGSRAWDGIIIDITLERQASETLQQAKEAAVAAERAKSDFLAVMSHEIRTPMNTVIGMTRLTLQTALAPKQRNYLEKIDASAKTLLSIIDDVLDFSKIEAGKMVLDDSEFTVEAVLESVSAVTAMRAEEKGIEIAFAIAPEVPRKLRGDALRLGQILTNLVSNAVKFTHQGEVVISIGLVPGTPTLLQFAVRDTGIGLDAAQIATLFKPFSQANSQTSQRYGGTGLGLVICKQLIEGMGGKIEVESQPGRGSTFRFTIQIAMPQRETMGLTRATRHPTHLEGRRVLIVDDNASTRGILLEMVRGFGMAANAVDSGINALAALRVASQNDKAFDLVLMDWRMPAMDGLETARRIKTEDRLRQMPAVLMVTAYGRDEVLQQVSTIGLQGLLIKPVIESVLFNTIMDILSDKSTLNAQSTLPLRRELLPHEVHSTLAGRRVLVVDDNALNREVAQDFLLAAGMEVDTAVDGLDALEQMEQQTYDAVLMDIHMPEMDGLAATREIRLQPRWASLPIVALTAQARVEDHKASVAAGMTTHLTKPIDETALYRTLIEVLAAAANSNSMDEQKIASQAEPETEEDVLDFAAASRRLGNNPDRVQRLLNAFLKDFATAPERMQAHLLNEDANAIALLAHSLKGAASYLDARRFCEIAERLEKAARQKDRASVKAFAPEFQSRLTNLLAQIYGNLAAPR